VSGCLPCAAADCFDALPTAQCIEILADTDTELRFRLTDSDGKSIDISLDQVDFTARDTIEGVELLTYSNAPGEHEDAGNGITAFTVLRADINGALDPADESADWVYEVRRIRPAGQQYVHIQGQFLVRPSIGGA